MRLDKGTHFQYGLQKIIQKKHTHTHNKDVKNKSNN